MLVIRLADTDEARRFCAEAKIPYETGVMACQAVEGGCGAGFVLFRAAGEELELLGTDCPPALLDGLLRAAINRGAAAGLVRFCFASSMQGWAGQLERLGYPPPGTPADIQGFFARGCRQISEEIR